MWYLHAKWVRLPCGLTARFGPRLASQGDKGEIDEDLITHEVQLRPWETWGGRY